MKSDELATEVLNIVAECQERITGIGAQQYALQDQQKFETMNYDALLVYMEEELLDQVNYAVMNLLRLRNIRKALSALESKSLITPGVEQPFSNYYNLSDLEDVVHAFRGEPRTGQTKDQGNS